MTERTKLLRNSQQSFLAIVSSELPAITRLDETFFFQIFQAFSMSNSV